MWGEVLFNKIYEKKEFIVFPMKNGYIAYNLNKNFKEGHTHLKHFDAAKMAIDLVLNKKIPKSTNFYYLQSLIRLAQDEEYIHEIENLIETRKRKGKKSKYYNQKFRN